MKLTTYIIAKRLAILLALAVSAVQAQSVWINDGGALREITGIFVNDSGTLREIESGWINDGGALRQFYTNIILSAGDGGTIQQGDGASPWGSTVGVRFNTDGTVDSGLQVNDLGIVWSAAGVWITPTSAASSAYDVRFTSCSQTTGTGFFTTVAAAEDTWIAISTWRDFTSYSSIEEEREFDCTFEVRVNTGDRPATGSAVYTLHIINFEI